MTLLRVARTYISFLCLLLMAGQVWAQLSIDSVYPTQGKLGEDLDVTITGTGFDVDTRVSMYLDSGNARHIRGVISRSGYGVALVGDEIYIADGRGVPQAGSVPRVRYRCESVRPTLREVRIVLPEPYRPPSRRPAT